MAVLLVLKEKDNKPGLHLAPAFVHTALPIKGGVMKKFIIERDLPKIGEASKDDLKGAAKTSNAALAELGKDIQWVKSYVAEDKTFCVYLASGEEIIRKHSELSGFPATIITEIKGIIDPTTARG